MAKFSYSKPAITFQAIPMVVGGGTGCYYNPEATGSHGTIEDEFGDKLFLIFPDPCTVTPPEGETNICYTVPLADANIYNS